MKKYMKPSLLHYIFKMLARGTKQPLIFLRAYNDLILLYFVHHIQADHIKKKQKNFHFHFINNLLLVLAFNKCMVCQCHIVVGIKVTNILACVPPVYIMFKYKYHTFYSQRDIMQIFKLIASQIFEIIH